MKEFIKNYLNVIATTLVGLVFVLTSFYFVMNYFHMEELKRTVYVSENDVYYKSYKDKLTQISNNLLSFRNKKGASLRTQIMYNQLNACYTALQDNGTLAKINVNQFYGPKDVYDLGSVFETSVLNYCWAANLSSLTEETAPEFKSVAPFIVSYVDAISNQNKNALSEIENNSSYFFETNMTSATIRNYLGSDYLMIVKSYDEFADIIVDLSNMINEVDGGSNV